MRCFYDHRHTATWAHDELKMLPPPSTGDIKIPCSHNNTPPIAQITPRYAQIHPHPRRHPRPCSYYPLSNLSQRCHPSDAQQTPPATSAARIAATAATAMSPRCSPASSAAPVSASSRGVRRLRCDQPARRARRSCYGTACPTSSSSASRPHQAGRHQPCELLPTTQPRLEKGNRARPSSASTSLSEF